MVTIIEDYVNFETAKLLKEKGFDGFCHRYYEYDIANYPDNTGGLCFMFASDFEQKGYCYVTNETFIRHNKEHKLTKLIAAPTQQMAMRWLREVHNLFIGIIPQEVELGIDNITYSIDGPTESLWNNIYQDKGFKTYEKACEAAIKYCLENLIK